MPGPYRLLGIRYTQNVIGKRQAEVGLATIYTLYVRWDNRLVWKMVDLLLSTTPKIKLLVEFCAICLH
jgi:hypothetical protein